MYLNRYYHVYNNKNKYFITAEEHNIAQLYN